MAPNNNDNDYALVRNKANEIDMDIAGELRNFHVFSLRQWVMSIDSLPSLPDCVEAWEEYFWDEEFVEEGRSIFVVRDEQAYGLNVDGDMGTDTWTLDEFDRTYVTIPDDRLVEKLGKSVR